MKFTLREYMIESNKLIRAANIRSKAEVTDEILETEKIMLWKACSNNPK